MTAGRARAARAVAGLMVRRHRLMLAAWTSLVIVLSGVTVPFYQSTYATAGQRRAAVEEAQHSTATTLLYGGLPDPGTPAQMFAWEIGAIVTLLAAFLGVLLAAALTRAAEEDGTLELLLTCGTAARAGLGGAGAVLAGTAAVLAGGCTLAVGASAGSVEAVTWPGAVAFGAVVGLTFLISAALTAVLAQLVATARGARLLGTAAIGAAVAVRAVADTKDLPWLNGLSPLALRTTVAPFTHDRWWVLAACAVVVAALAGAAVLLFDRREYGAGLLPSRRPSGGRLRVRSGVGLDFRLGRASIAVWAVAVAGIGSLFAAMGSGAVQRGREGEVKGFLGAQMGTGDPAAGYFSFYGTVVGLAVAVFAVLTTLRAARAEQAGLTDQVLCTGRRRWEPLAAAAAVAFAGSGAVLLLTGAAGALIAPTAITGTDVALRAFTYSAGQWPAAAAAAGWTVLLIGLRPRLAPLAWAPFAASAALALLGRLLRVPERIRDLGVFQHVPDLAAPDPDPTALAVLLAVAALTTAAGLAAAARRDVAA
ncbi:hypothetical protein [Actinomadura parmotrematis]|uniref:ABC transporter permease n=1 Tax=Actinomadura parmotrematis TaxID=2864039 RepID=A0ABS7G217_9ACTN|nr:hypothetical protein [Actinomadura parmotrematis]MBW8486749.1 hypothetical protein [Actinomadura parmotrematis]